MKGIAHGIADGGKNELHPERSRRTHGIDPGNRKRLIVIAGYLSALRGEDLWGHHRNSQVPLS
jgi:hypothetical protein